MVYALEAENTNGWCLPEGQLAIAGIQVARAVYDTLTIPNEDAEYVPFLAESVEANDDFTEWTIKVREGVTFHDDTELTGEVVRNNIEAWRGKYPGRTALLLQFVFSNIASTELVDPMTVKVTTATPWPSFDAYLFLSGRAGIMAQSQLDDTQTCDAKLVGTGPFEQVEWTENESFLAKKNPDYWQKDADGNQLPYLDEIEFRPIVDGEARQNSLIGGEISALHTSGAEQVQFLQAEAESGNVNLTSSDDFAEVSYGLFNTSRPPFDNINARKAAAYAFDSEGFNQVRNLDLFTMASGPFAPGEIGYLEDAGFPRYDLDEAKKYAALYQEETGNPLEFTISSVDDPSTLASVEFIQNNAEAVGATVRVRPIAQAELITTAISGDFQALSWRNHPGGNPDGQYVWWHSTSPANFGRINDPELDRLLDEGRAETDEERRREIYEDVNRLFADKVYNLWFNWTQWNVATAPNVFGVYGPDLPDGSKPFTGLATGHSVTGMWIEE